MLYIIYSSDALPFFFFFLRSNESFRWSQIAICQQPNLKVPNFNFNYKHQTHSHLNF